MEDVLFWLFSFALLANSCMKDCFIGCHAETIRHISTAIALSAFKNIFHITVYSYNLKMKTIFSYCLLNLGRGSIHLEKMDTTVFL